MSELDNLYKALAFTLKWEGGYVNDPHDPGGETNKGITKLVYDNYRRLAKLPIQSVRLISANEIYDIYEHNYWLNMGCDKMKDIKLAISVFDFGVNGGTARAIKWYKICNNDYKVYNVSRIVYYNNLVKMLSKHI
jgi:lysozyme family protein